MTENTIIRLNGNGPERTGLTSWKWPYPASGDGESEKVIDGDPVEIGYNYFSNYTGQLTAGVWECTPYTSQIDSYPVDEFCFILSGKVVITDADGRAETFKAGECFVIPKGLKCTWHMPETVRKFYVIFEDKGGAQQAAE